MVRCRWFAIQGDCLLTPPSSISGFVTLTFGSTSSQVYSPVSTRLSAFDAMSWASRSQRVHVARMLLPQRQRQPLHQTHI